MRNSEEATETDKTTKKKEIISIVETILALIIRSGEMFVGKWEGINLKAEVLIVPINIYTRVRMAQSTTAFSRKGNGGWIQSQRGT